MNIRLYIFRILSSKKIQGFTIVELLVVMGIISLLSGGVIAGFSRFTEKQKIISEAQKLKTNLRKAQSKAISGVKPPGCTDFSNTLVGYRVTFNGSNYITEAVCSSGAYNLETVKLPDNVTVSTTFGNSVTYYPLGRGADKNGTIILTNTITTETVSILITTGGDISGQ